MAGDRVPLSAVKDIAEVVEDPHIAARDMIVDVEYPGGPVGMFGLPVKLSRTPGTRARSHLAGPAQRRRLRQGARLSADELRELRSRG